MLNTKETTVKIAEHFDDLYQKVADETIHPKNEYLRLLILLRMMIRSVLATQNQANLDLRYYRRQKKLMERQGISFILLDAAILQKEEVYDTTKKALVRFGEDVSLLLDSWQYAGATYEELFNLCGSHRMKNWKKERLSIEKDREFSGLAFVYNLDYPDDGSEWIEETTDAPFTHALKEHMFDRITNTEAGQRAAHKAIEAVFPGLFENAMTITTDVEGRRCLVDKDGEIVGYLDGRSGEDVKPT